MAMNYDGMNGSEMDTSDSRKRPLDGDTDNGVTKRSNQGEFRFLAAHLIHLEADRRMFRLPSKSRWRMFQQPAFVRWVCRHFWNSMCLIES